MTDRIEIVPMGAEHREAVLSMMRAFYRSPAVLSDGSEEIFTADVEACIGECPYLTGYVFIDAGAVAGYAMTAHSFSTEFGRPCVWIEDLYLLPPYRGQGLAGRFFAFLDEKHPGAIQRLEAEPENAPALRAYRKAGFEVLPYTEMKK